MNTSYTLTVIEALINQEVNDFKQAGISSPEEQPEKFEIPKWLSSLVSEIDVLKKDNAHKERAHESLVEKFFELLGYNRFEDIKHRQGRIDI